MLRFISLTLLAIAFVPLTSAAQQLQVESMVFASSVVNGQPSGVDTVFSSSTNKIYCYTHITGATDTTQISHIWYYDNEQKAKVDLPVRSGNWHTWSSKSILPSWSGVWHVDVVDARGNVLSSQKFRISGSSVQ